MKKRNELIGSAASQLCNGDAIFYVGAGFSMIAEMPGWGRLLDELIAKIPLESDSVAVNLPSLVSIANAAGAARRSGNFQYAASLISLALSSRVISEIVQQRFKRKRIYSESTEFRIESRLQSVFSAPICGVITTNYDDIFESHRDFSRWFSVVSLNSVDLPVLFGRGDLHKRFFLKIHGDLNGEVVLSTEDYDRVYLSSPRAELFLRSCLMQNPIVFLGCSVEDSILNQRRRLFDLFGPGLPPCFQVTSRSANAEVRAHWLRSYAGIQTLFYESEDSSHIEFDFFLSQLAERMREENLAKFGIRPSRLIRNTLKKDGRFTKDNLGAINYRIIEVVRGQPNSQCSYLNLLNDVSKTLPGVDLESIFYRVAFLVSIGALKESNDNEVVISVQI